MKNKTKILVGALIVLAAAAIIIDCAFVFSQPATVQEAGESAAQTPGAAQAGGAPQTTTNPLAPRIQGAKNRTIYTSAHYDLRKGVTVVAQEGATAQLAVEDQGFDPTMVGKYKVTYVADDGLGNTARKSVTVTVKARAQKDRWSGTMPKGKVVYLTLDDGPSENTPTILKILDKYKVKATFFVTHNDPNADALYKQIVAHGDAIALHSYTHDYAKIYRSDKAFFEDLDKLAAAVKKTIGYVPKVVRFPGGSSNTVSRHYSQGIMERLASELHARGYIYEDWNNSVGDASLGVVTVGSELANLRRSAAPQIMLLAHDTKATTVKALPKIIEYYKSRGYRFETVTHSTPEYHQPIAN